jgi:tripartite-type tricarboxylate transporter receptor subunit TctC
LADDIVDGNDPVVLQGGRTAPKRGGTRTGHAGMQNAISLIGRRAVLGTALALPFAGAARAFTDRPVRLLLGFPPGTAPDTVARILADGLREPWPAGVVVENRTGAGGHIAAPEVARAAPDGTTLLLGELGTLAMAPSTHARLTFDPARDFAPIAEVASIGFAFVVPAALPVTDMAGYIAWARAQSQVFMGTFGAGTPGHFGASLLASGAGITAESVHFRNTGEAMSAILGGNVQGMFGTIALVAPHVQAGRLKALAVTTTEPAAQLPGVPTVGQIGRPDLAFRSWFGVVAPAATPEPVQAAIEAGIRRALAQSAPRTRLQDAGFRVAEGGRTEFAALIRAETSRWAEVVRATGFRAIE